MELKGLTLTKNERLNLTKELQLKLLQIGLGWSANEDKSGYSYDLDATALLLNANGKVRTNSDVIFYHQLKSECGSVTHMGDNKTGDAEGDDEVIKIDLSQVPADVEKILFIVTIYNATKRKQTFGQVKDAYIRLLNIEDNNNLIARYNLSENYAFDKSMIMGELVRTGNDWEFVALGNGSEEELGALLIKHGAV